LSLANSWNRNSAAAMKTMNPALAPVANSTPMNTT